MACFLVPASEAVVTTVIEKIARSRENEKKDLTVTAETDNLKVSFSEKLGWLNRMLWGGSALLAFEHLWHGEVVPTFPFLTAVSDGETSEMLHEMGTAGVGMALLVTAVWGCMVAVSVIIGKRGVHASDDIRKEV
ncbi:MAG: hypothetical protein J5910_00510 [Lachnospiraceae bacterium]|nr:hypothetical protein [Lachnospiraceae bacterium]